MVQQSPCNSQWHATGAAASDLSRPTAVKWCRHQLPSRYWTVQTDCSGEENQWWGSHQEGIRPSHLLWKRHPGNIPVSRSTIAAPEIVGHNSSLDVLRYEMDAGSPGVFVLWLVADGENDSNHSTSNVHTSKLIEKQLPVHHIRQRMNEFHTRNGYQMRKEIPTRYGYLRGMCSTVLSMLCSDVSVMMPQISQQEQPLIIESRCMSLESCQILLWIFAIWTRVGRTFLMSYWRSPMRWSSTGQRKTTGDKG